MIGADPQFLHALFDGSAFGSRCAVGDIDGESVLALLIKLPQEAASKLTNAGPLEAIWDWTYVDREGQIGLALNFEIGFEDQLLVSDQVVFLVRHEESMAMLRCLMRQDCLPTIILDGDLKEVSKAGFDWTSTDRSEVSSLTGAVLRLAYAGRDTISSDHTAA